MAVFDLFGKKYEEKPEQESKNSTSDKDDKADSAKADKAERLIDHYCSHLNMIISYRSYGDYMDPSEIVKMSQIQLCVKISQHPKASILGGLYNAVIDIVRRTSSAQDFASWQKAIDNEISRVRNANNMNALTCSTDSWSDRNSEGKPKSPILCAIVAIRFLLEQRKFSLKEDVWKSYSLISDESGKEEYVSRQTDAIIREWRNWIYEHKGTMYSLEILKDAYHQIAKNNEFHSLQGKIKSVVHDGTDRYEEGAKAFGLKIDDFTVRAFKQHLLASMARVFYPGVWYDLVFCIFGNQGAGKTTGLRILYGRDNVISCNFFELDPKKQSEATRHGISCVENPDTFGDARKADFNRIKADVSTDSFVGRDAYGRMEDMRRVNITYVIWYTGNDVNVLRDPTGNRRFIIVYSEAPIDEHWLRSNSGQLWAQVYKDMEQLRSDYLDEMRRKGINEDYPKFLELPRDLWDEAKKRQGASMVINEQLEDWVPDIIFQNFVVWPLKGTKGKKSIHFLTRDIVKWLRDKGYNSISNQAISYAIDKHVVLSKNKVSPTDDRNGLNEDIKWKSAQIKRKQGNLRGYRIDFEGEAQFEAFGILEKIVAAESTSPEATFDEKMLDTFDSAPETPPFTSNKPM
jgi:Virulence-associated protein E